jgi:tetratricopeptide (TPR) repeat protein
VDKADGDYLDQLDQMSKTIDGGDRLVHTEPAIIDLDDLEIPTLRAPLEEAQRLIDEKEYAKALEQLLDSLTARGEPQEVVYLIAKCHHKLDRPEDALDTLLPLQGATLEHRVAEPIKQLKHEIRRKIMAVVLLENLLLVRKGQPEKPIERLRRLTRLDPQFGVFHFMLAGNLMTADRMEEALDAVETGLQESDREHHKQLEGLRENIVRRLLEVKMQKARAHYRKRRYAKARSALEKLDERYREDRLWISFHRYLEQLGGGVLSRGKDPRKVKPSGSFKDVDALHFFLVRSEIAQAKLAIAMGLHGPAIQVLEPALSYAPHFPYLHFLTAHCLYKRTAEALKSDSRPSPDEVLEDLTTALKHAREGAKDKEIGSAKELQGALESAIEAMREVQAELEVRKKEAVEVNLVIEDYKAVMELVGDGISSREQWQKICTAMGKVKTEIGSARAKVNGPEAQKALDQLEKVVDNNMGQLDALEPKIRQAELIQEAWEEFKSIMSSAEGGISSRDDAERLQAKLLELSVRVTELRASTEDEQAKEALDKLQEAVDRNYEQITEVLITPPEPPPEVKEFNALAEEFKDLMESVQRRKISTRSELDDFKGKLGDIVVRTMNLKDKMTEGKGKEAVDQLWEAIMNVVKQLPQ